jgi:hypothetical protein
MIRVLSLAVPFKLDTVTTTVLFPFIKLTLNDTKPVEGSKLKFKLALFTVTATPEECAIFVVMAVTVLFATLVSKGLDEGSVIFTVGGLTTTGG